MNNKKSDLQSIKAEISQIKCSLIVCSVCSIIIAVVLSVFYLFLDEKFSLYWVSVCIYAAMPWGFRVLPKTKRCCFRIELMKKLTLSLAIGLIALPVSLIKDIKKIKDLKRHY